MFFFKMAFCAAILYLSIRNKIDLYYILYISTYIHRAMKLIKKKVTLLLKDLSSENISYKRILYYFNRNNWSQIVFKYFINFIKKNCFH